MLAGRPWQDWVGLLARLVLGGALFIAGALKVGNPEASVIAVRAYQILPFSLTRPLGYALPLFEMLLGALILLGLFTRIAAALGTLVMLAFIIAIASAWARGLSIDCGCFGGGGEIAPDQTKYALEIVRDIGFAAAGAWLVWRPRSAFALDSWLFRPIDVPADADPTTD